MYPCVCMHVYVWVTVWNKKGRCYAPHNHCSLEKFANLLKAKIHPFFEQPSLTKQGSGTMYWLCVADCAYVITLKEGKRAWAIHNSHAIQTKLNLKTWEWRVTPHFISPIKLTALKGNQTMRRFASRAPAPISENLPHSELHNNSLQVKRYFQFKLHKLRFNFINKFKT